MNKWDNKQGRQTLSNAPLTHAIHEYRDILLLALISLATCL